MQLTYNLRAGRRTGGMGGGGRGRISILVNRMHYISQEIDLKSWIKILVTLYQAYNMTFAKYLLSYDKKQLNL